MANPTMPQPLVVDIGKQTSKKIKRLRKGTGRLPAKVDAAIREARSLVGTDKQIVPVVVIYQKKDRRKLRSLPFLGPF
jgi:uncharacterized protein (UPF0335 family)